MDSSSWIHGNGSGGGGFMCGYTGRCTDAFQYREHDELLVSSQIQQHLNQIHMELNMDDDEPAAAAYSQHGSSVVDGLGFLASSYHATGGGCSFPSSSSISASFSCSPENSSTAAHVLTGATGLQFPEVSSFVAPGGVALLPCYDDQYVDSFQETPTAMAPGRMSSTTSAFRRYDRHLAPKSRLTTPACGGQRMFKTALSVLSRMQTAIKYSHQRQQQASAVEPLGGHQLQHLISERRRRQRLNDSFRALKTVLPFAPKSKKSGQASILIAAREYVNSLKSRVCELEEKNEALQSELARHTARAAEEDGAGEKVEIQITRAVAAEDHQTGEVCTVKILTPARGNTTTDVVLRILQNLKDVMGENVSLVSMSTGEDVDGPRRASLTLQLKSASGAKWEEEAVREAVRKAVTSLAPAGLSGAE